MWLQYILGLAIFYLGFTYLKQIATWTLPSFRQGMIVYRYSEPFSGQIPKELINREIVIKNIIFRFLSPNAGLFKAYPLMSLFKDRMRNYFPSVLGEVDLSRQGIAQITLRIPLSILLIALFIFIALTLFNTEGAFTITSILLGAAKATFILVIFGAFFVIHFLREREHLQEGFMMLKERTKTGPLG